MDQDILQPAARPAVAPIPVLTPLKHALYAWRSVNLFDDSGMPFRGVRYSKDANPELGWVRVGPVGCLFSTKVTFQDGSVSTQPLVQFERPVSDGMAYTLELAPYSEDCSEFKQWVDLRMESEHTGFEILGYALPPTHTETDQYTLPLLSTRVKDLGGLTLNQAVTTNVAVWDSLVAGSRTRFSLVNQVTPGATPIAQIPPVFEIEVDLVGTTIVPTVRVGIQGANGGDLEVPPGTCALIRYFRRAGTDFALDNVTFALNGSPATGFSNVVLSGAEILVEDTAAADLYDYSIFVTTPAGDVLQLDPKVRNRPSVTG